MHPATANPVPPASYSSLSLTVRVMPDGSVWAYLMETQTTAGRVVWAEHTRDRRPTPAAWQEAVAAAVAHLIDLETSRATTGVSL